MHRRLERPLERLDRCPPVVALAAGGLAAGAVVGMTGCGVVATWLARGGGDVGPFLWTLFEVPAWALLPSLGIAVTGWWLGRSAPGWLPPSGEVGPPPPPEPLLDLVDVPAGRFRMGSTDYPDEQPVHEVRLAAFRMARTPVTRGQYAEVLGQAPPEDPELPQTGVSWFDAAGFCNRLSALEGLNPVYDEATWERDPRADGYRLPTEAEWEYACRAGTTTRWWWGDDERAALRHAWFSANADGPQPVGAEGHANAWGLSDLAGNVWEWCGDGYGAYPSGLVDNPTGPVNGPDRVLRGGSFVYDPVFLRSACRSWFVPVDSNWVIGFRCVCGPRPQH